MLYAISGLSGAALSFLFSYHAAVVGASAAIYGVFIGFTWFWPRAQIYVWGILPVEARIMVVIMTAMSLFQIFGGGGDGIAHFAHLGGFVGGWMYLRVVAPGHFATSPAAPKPRVVAADPAAVARWRAIRPEALHAVNREEYRRVVAKLDASGPASLSPEEIVFLERFSARQSGDTGQAGQT